MVVAVTENTMKFLTKANVVVIPLKHCTFRLPCSITQYNLWYFLPLNTVKLIFACLLLAPLYVSSVRNPTFYLSFFPILTQYHV